MKIWLDDLREAPEGYILCHSVNEAKQRIEENEKLTTIEVIDCDHDLGDYYPDGGDGTSIIHKICSRMHLGKPTILNVLSASDTSSL